ncbi:cob(I)yrinic acid a,c-diamide adenosyltransferase [Mycoplasma sp. ATU-Cv-508]|uniref:cob(I)yrinic acid a,c-diamide adenosyltransferase n=1 Tax=Mycoplasma sp. ATU-Cv-508 TaxID=2048001 RepID=UPI000FDD2B88
MLHIYWGFGKGKTSALNGSAIRAKGAGMRVAYYRFLKGRPSSENEILKLVGVPPVHFHHTGKFVIEMDQNEKEKTRKIVYEGLEQIKKTKDQFDVIIIDEILDLAASSVQLFSEQYLANFFKKLGIEKREVLISGHVKLKQVFDLADLITHFEPQKHYFNRGLKARQGIEF